MSRRANVAGLPPYGFSRHVAGMCSTCVVFSASLVSPPKGFKVEIRRTFSRASVDTSLVHKDLVDIGAELTPCGVQHLPAWVIVEHRFFVVPN